MAGGSGSNSPNVTDFSVLDTSMNPVPIVLDGKNNTMYIRGTNINTSNFSVCITDADHNSYNGGAPIFGHTGSTVSGFAIKVDFMAHVHTFASHNGDDDKGTATPSNVQVNVTVTNNPDGTGSGAAAGPQYGKVVPVSPS